MDGSNLAGVGIYIGVNALIMVALFANALRKRQRAGVSNGDGGNAALLRAMRGQANAAENVPIALLLLLVLALMGAWGWLLHFLGLALTTGRMIHALYFMRGDIPMACRILGTALTAGTIATGALFVIALATLSMT